MKLTAAGKFWLSYGLLTLLALTTLAGCASTAPVITEVKVPVSVPCIKPEQVPARPLYETPYLTETATNGNKVLALARDWARSRGYESKLEAIAAECSK